MPQQTLWLAEAGEIAIEYIWVWRKILNTFHAFQKLNYLNYLSYYINCNGGYYEAT
jgi:ribosomal protein L19E